MFLMIIYDTQLIITDGVIFLNKLRISDGKIKRIDDYGLYDFFDYSDHGEQLNFVATVVDDMYITISDYANSIYHCELENIIYKKFGKYGLKVRSFEDSLVIWKDDKLSLIEFEVILGLLNEVKKYTQKTKITKDIEINALDFHLFNFSEFIDDVISDFNGKRDDMSLIKKKK